MNEIIAIAKKEVMDNWRNKWLIAVSAIFMILTLVISYFGSMGSAGWKDLNTTIGGMIALVQILVPIIGLMLGYATIAGEKERGSLALLLSYPVSRVEILIGKFLGLGAVLAIANIAGFGVAGIVIGINVKGVQWGAYFVFIFASILLGLVFISISMLFSCIFKKRSTALGGAIFLWFLFTMIWGTILSGILIAKYGLSAMMNEDWMAPTWYYIASIINPISAFSVLVSINVTPISTHLTRYPSFYTTPVTLLILLSWITISLVLAYYLFTKKDL
ncbi:MAG: hypothetical protein DRN29_01300 [Thermoplasmata archaeon]|nr:MAG: hypothetical protein DRN29_01300 [Thermoplasmata archaeon]